MVNSYPTTFDEGQTNIYITHWNEGAYLDTVYEFPLKSVLETGPWSEVESDCYYDFTIEYIGTKIYYHSDCGRIKYNGKSKQLSILDKENVDKLLFSLFEENDTESTTE